MVIEINTIEEFDSKIKESELVVVDAYASWCGPCKMLAPHIEKASSERSNITFLKVDIDKVEEVPERYQITSIPTVLFFKNGRMIRDNLGYLALEELLKLIDNTFKD